MGSSVTVEVPASKIATELGLPSWYMRVYFSSYHLWAAKHFLEISKEIEESSKELPAFEIRHRAFTINSILSSVAFVEAAINEVFQDALDNHHFYIESLGKDKIELLADYWRMTEIEKKSHLSALDKYQLALRFCGREPFKKDENPYQDANLIIKLRNTLIHYKPESFSPDKPHKLGNQLKGKFPENNLVSKSANPYFPDKCLGYGCANWSCKSMEKFTDAFFQKLGIEPSYKKVSFLNPEVADK